MVDNSTSPAVTSLAPGDICTLDSQCYGLGTCLNGVCQAYDSSVGASCADIVVDDVLVHSGDKMCSMGQYCHVNDENPEQSKCKAVLNTGASCLYDDQCGYGSACIYGLCTELGTLQHGQPIED